MAKGGAVMNRQPETNAIRLPAHEEPVGPVTILDGQGRVMRVVPAREFRPALEARTSPTLARARRSKGSA
jgi:hypothetical protein